jgi:hypothetical protein
MVRSVAGPTGKEMQRRPPASLRVLDHASGEGKCGFAANESRSAVSDSGAYRVIRPRLTSTFDVLIVYC